MERMRQRESRIAGGLGKLALWGGLAFYASILVLSLIGSGFGGGGIGPAVGLAAGVVAVFAIGFRGLNRPSRSSYPAFLILAALLLRVAWVLVADTQPTSDFKVMYDYGVKAASGDFAFGHMDYYVRWVYQLGYTLYEGLIVRLFGESLIPLKLFNALFETVTVWLVYRLAANLFGETSGRIAGLLYATYVPNVIMCSVLTNQHLSTMLFAAGCAIAVSPRGRNGIAGVVAVGACFALGSAFRPMGAFYAGVFLVFLVLYEWTKAGGPRRRLGAMVVRGASFAAAFVLVQQIIAYSLIASGVTELKLHENREPYWKFMVGLNAESNGQWNEKDARYVVEYPLGPERDEVEKTILTERLRDPGQVLALMARKWAYMWAGPDDSPHWSLGTATLGSEWRNWLVSLERGQYLAFALFGGFAMLKLLFPGRRARERTERGSGRAIAVLLPVLILLAYAALHQVIEVQIRYRLDILPFYIALSGFGCASLSAGIGRTSIPRRASGSAGTKAPPSISA